MVSIPPLAGLVRPLLPPNSSGRMASALAAYSDAVTEPRMVHTVTTSMRMLPQSKGSLKAAGLPCKTWSPTSGGGWGGHTFVGSRGSDTIASFDSLGSDTLEMGYPDMDPFPG